MTDQLISESITVDAPPAVVFAILADPRQHSRIDGSGSVQSIISAPDRVTRKGQTFTVRMKLFGLPYLIRNRVVEFEADRRIAWRHFTANRWRYELAPTPDGGTRVTETFDPSRADRITASVVRWAKFHERNRDRDHRNAGAAEEGRRGRRSDDRPPGVAVRRVGAGASRGAAAALSGAERHLAAVSPGGRQIMSRRGRTVAASRGPAGGRHRLVALLRRTGGVTGSSSKQLAADERLRVVLAQVEVAQFGQVVAE